MARLLYGRSENNLHELLAIGPSFDHDQIPLRPKLHRLGWNRSLPWRWVLRRVGDLKKHRDLSSHLQRFFIFECEDVFFYPYHIHIYVPGTHLSFVFLQRKVFSNQNKGHLGHRYIYIFHIQNSQVFGLFWLGECFPHILHSKDWSKDCHDGSMVYLPTWMVDLYGKCR